MKASEIMTKDPQCCTREDSLSEAARIMRDLDVGIVPVVDDRSSMRLSGVITDRDIAIRHVADSHPNECTVGDHMTASDVRTVAPDADVDDLMKSMRDDQVRRIPVVDNGRLVGIIAQADIAADGPSRKDVGSTVREISEPAKPRR
jgi:CBS domain-containing protein